jgi:hypothetical protein
MSSVCLLRVVVPGTWASAGWSWQYFTRIASIPAPVGTSNGSIT